MALPLFSADELRTFEDKLNKLETLWRGNRASVDFDSYWKQKTSLCDAHHLEKVKRSQARADEFLKGLIVIVGSKGHTFVEFDELFINEDPQIDALFAEVNTPETRRNLYTILRALTEIPKSWAYSAFTRFLRGTGKQKDSKYHGAGTFGVAYGWKAAEAEQIIRQLADKGNPYADVLMYHADVAQEIEDADPDYEVVDYQTKFYATRVERDKVFLNLLCEKLEKQGLGPVPVPAEEKPKKVRVPKVFKAGDILRQSNLRDLPLPAHVRIPIKKWVSEKEKVDATLEVVITQLGSNGYYSWVLVKPNTDKAYPPAEYNNSSKRYLEGAVFLGPWKGTIAKEKELKLNFRWHHNF